MTNRMSSRIMRVHFSVTILFFVWAAQDELYEFKCDMRNNQTELAAQEKEVTTEVGEKKMCYISNKNTHHSAVRSRTLSKLIFASSV